MEQVTRKKATDTTKVLDKVASASGIRALRRGFTKYSAWATSLVVPELKMRFTLLRAELKMRFTLLREWPKHRTSSQSGDSSPKPSLKNPQTPTPQNDQTQRPQT